MSGRTADLAACALGYVVGSIPIGVLMGRATRGLDVRDHGSGSMGSTNVLRAIGPGAAAATAVLDVAKGTSAVLLARGLGAGSAGRAGAGFGSIVGHCWPMFAHFRGGKGVATAWGALVPISYGTSRFALGGFIAGFVSTRIVSVASLTAAAAAATGGMANSLRSGRGLPAIYAVPASALVVARHAGNLRRLARGLEPKVKFRPS